MPAGTLAKSSSNSTYSPRYTDHRIETRLLRPQPFFISPVESNTFIRALGSLEDEVSADGTNFGVAKAIKQSR